MNKIGFEFEKNDFKDDFQHPLVPILRHLLSSSHPFPQHGCRHLHFFRLAKYFGTQAHESGFQGTGTVPIMPLKGKLMQILEIFM